MREVRFTRTPSAVAALLLCVAGSMLLTGCGPSYRALRMQGQTAMADQAYGSARYFFEEAERKSPRRLENIYDMATCSVMLARDRMEERNYPASMRELDDAIAYYRRALEIRPAHQASLEGLNAALELRGDHDRALEEAEWAARFVGPMARQYVFLARELEERGDVDGALLRFQQAVSIEPRNAMAHREFARFLLKSGNEPAAVYHMQVAYRLDPADDWVMQELVARGRLPALTGEPPTRP